MAPPAQQRRLARLCEHLLVLAPSPAAGVGDQLASEVKAILEALGPEPLRVGCQKIYYKLDDHLPPLKEREAQGPAEALKPELIARIHALSPPPYKPLDGENQDKFIARLMALDAPPAAEDGASDGSLQVLKSLLLLGAGALDEAHNLAVTTQVSRRYKGSGARRDATYVHGLCHRREGKYENNDEGDDHRSGWQSSGMFFNAIDKHPLYPKVLEEARRLAAGKMMIEADIKKMGNQWDALRFVKILMELEQTGDWDLGGQRVKSNPAVQAAMKENAEFCNKLMNVEWRLLVDHVMAQTKALA